MATYLIAGANRGIGYEYCCQLLSRGDLPIAVCRNSSPELDALGIRVIAVGSIESVVSYREPLGGEYSTSGCSEVQLR
jgi:NAD(P)-dependent dehydrogenase (short-subunit alcohol dehydrogenase family)